MRTNFDLKSKLEIAKLKSEPKNRIIVKKGSESLAKKQIRSSDKLT